MIFGRKKEKNSESHVIKWPDHLDPMEYIAWKYPKDVIKHGSFLIVNESQRAIFLRDGKIMGTISAGRHRLDTQNIPFLRSLMTRVAGGESPFKANVLFVNLLQYDAEFGDRAFIDWVGVHLQFHGNYYFTVDENRLETFYTRLVGLRDEVTVDDVRNKINPFIVSTILDAFAEYSNEQARAGRTVQNVADFMAMLNEFSDYAKSRIAQKVDEMYGIKIIDMAFRVDVSDEDKRILQMSGPRAYAAMYEREWTGREKVSENVAKAKSPTPFFVAPWTMYPPPPPPAQAAQQPMTPPARPQQATSNPYQQQPPPGYQQPYQPYPQYPPPGYQQPQQGQQGPPPQQYQQAPPQLQQPRQPPQQPPAPQKPRCPYCGKEIPLFSPVCPYCAQPIKWCPDGRPVRHDQSC